MFACKMTKHKRLQIISILILFIFALVTMVFVSGCNSFFPPAAVTGPASATSQSEDTTIQLEETTSQSEDTTSQSITQAESDLTTETTPVPSLNSSSEVTSSKDSNAAKTNEKLLVLLVVVLVVLLVVFFPLLLYVLIRLKRCEKISDRNMKLFDQSRDKQKSSSRNSQNKNSLANGPQNNWWNNQPDYVTRSEYEGLEQKVNRLLATSNQNAVSQPQDQQVTPMNKSQIINKPDIHTNSRINASAISQSAEELNRIFNQYSQYSAQEINQIQDTHNFVSMRVDQYVTGALSSALLSDSNGKDARYLRPANPCNPGGQFYVIPNPTNRNYTEIELGNIAPLFDVPHQTYTGNKPIKLLKPAIITRTGKAFSLIQKGQIEFL